MNYYLVGPIPPPLGGVSVFIYRFSCSLQEKGINVKNVDLYKMSIIAKLFFLLNTILNPTPATYHLNTYDSSVMCALLFRPFKAYLIFHEHSGRSVQNFPRWKKIIFKLFLKKIDECIFVGEHIPSYYQKNGFNLPEKIKIENSFMPPPPNDERKIWDSYSPNTIQFINTHFPLIVANAYKIVHFNGVDLYGLDMCVKLVAMLKVKYPDVGLLFALAEIGDLNYFELLNQEIEKGNIAGNFHFMLGQKELWPIFKKANLMIRPTYVDGFGISVAEALYFKCPSIASNVCVRAEGTIYFENRNIDDLFVKVMEVLNGTTWKRVL